MMNHALTYLWFALLKRRVLQFLANLRRPVALIGFLAVLTLIGVMFHFRREEIFAQIVRRESLIGGMLIMLCGSLFKGFLQRGLPFELPDVDFLFTGAFTQRQIVCYRLMPQYLFAVVQGLFFLAIFESHLTQPLLTTLCFILFQIVCFHIATASAILSGTIPRDVHYRICWMLLGAYFVITVFYLRTAWDLHVVPQFVTSLPQQILFYPTISLSDAGTGSAFQQWMRQPGALSGVSAQIVWEWTKYLGTFAVGAWTSLWLLLKFKANIFENSLAITSEMANRRQRVQRGQSVAALNEAQFRSEPLPRWTFFRGAGAIVWKNFVVAKRSKRELTLALVFTLVFTLFIIGIRWAMHKAISNSNQLSDADLGDFDMGLASLMGFLSFLLQRALPFDFRRDGHHLVGFRTLPFSPFKLALAEISVPIFLCLAFELLGVTAVMLFASFKWYVLVCLVLGYPAVALALNGVWNLHYLLSAMRRAGGKAQSSSAVGALLIVALSFMIFYPAGWTADKLGHYIRGKESVPIAIAASLAVQYFVDFLLVVLLAKLFERFEVPRDA